MAPTIVGASCPSWSWRTGEYIPLCHLQITCAFQTKSHVNYCCVPLTTASTSSAVTSQKCRNDHPLTYSLLHNRPSQSAHSLLRESVPVIAANSTFSAVGPAHVGTLIIATIDELYLLCHCCIIQQTHNHPSRISPRHIHVASRHKIVQAGITQLCAFVLVGIVIMQCSDFLAATMARFHNCPQISMCFARPHFFAPKRNATPLISGSGSFLSLAFLLPRPHLPNG